MLSVSHLSGGYTPGINTIKDINATIRKGVVTAIVGPNGAGKSTLLKAALGLLPHCEGKICYEDKDIKNLNPKERAKTLAISTSRPSITNQNVKEYCLMGRTAHRSIFSLTDKATDYEIAEKAMQTLGIESLANLSVSKLSDGQRQLASLARAITQEPQVLLLDEPTANLDPANQLLVLSKIQKITKQKQMSTIIVLHDINQASQWTDDIIMMRDGRITHQGETTSTLSATTLFETYGILFETAETSNGQKYYFPQQQTHY